MPTHLDTLAREIADKVRPAGYTPAITAVTGRPDTIAIVWNGLPERFTDTLTALYQEILATSTSTDGSRRCILVTLDSEDDIGTAILTPIAAALDVADPDNEANEYELPDADDDAEIERIFAAIAA